MKFIFRPTRLALAAVLLTAAISAHADTLIGNLPATNDDAQTVIYTGHWKAVSFTTGADAFLVDSVTLRLEGYSTTARQKTTAYFTLDDAGHPGDTVFASLVSPSSSSEEIASYVFTTAGILLAGNTTYWLVVTPAEELSLFGWKGADPGAAPTGIAAFGAYRYTTDAGNVWVTSPVGNSFTITGTVVPVPESRDIGIIMGIALLALVMMRRRQPSASR